MAGLITLLKYSIVVNPYRDQSEIQSEMVAGALPLVLGLRRRFWNPAVGHLEHVLGDGELAVRQREHAHAHRIVSAAN